MSEGNVAGFPANKIIRKSTWGVGGWVNRAIHYDGTMVRHDKVTFFYGFGQLANHTH